MSATEPKIGRKSSSQKGFDLAGLLLGTALAVLGIWGLWGDTGGARRDVAPGDVIARVTEYKNDVRVNAFDRQQGWAPVRSRLSVADGDSLYTADASSAVVMLVDQKIFLGEKTLVVLRKAGEKRLSVKLNSGRIVLKPRDKTAPAVPLEIQLQNDKKLVVYDNAVVALSAPPTEDPDVAPESVPEVKVEVLSGRAEMLETTPGAEGPRVETLAPIEAPKRVVHAPELISPAADAVLTLGKKDPTEFRWKSFEADKSAVLRWRSFGAASFSESAVDGDRATLQGLPEGFVEWTVIPRDSEFLGEDPVYRRLEIRRPSPALPPPAPKLDPVYEIEIDDEHETTGDQANLLLRLWDLVLPSAGAQDRRGVARIRWASDPQAVAYEVKVFVSRDFSSAPVITREVKSSEFSLRSSGLRSGRYWIQVRTIGAGGIKSEPSVAELVIRRRERPVAPPDPVPAIVETGAPEADEIPQVASETAEADVTPASVDPSATLYFGGLGKNAKFVASFGVPPLAFKGLEARVGAWVTRDVVLFEGDTEKTYYLLAGFADLLAPKWRLGEKLMLRLLLGYEYSEIPWFIADLSEEKTGVFGPRAAFTLRRELSDTSSLRVGLRLVKPMIHRGEGQLTTRVWWEIPVIWEFLRRQGIAYSFYATYDDKVSDQSLDGDSRRIVDRGLKIGFQIEGVSQ
jgi:hypothetical protein